MKRIKGIGYIVLIVIVAVLSLTIYTEASKDSRKKSKRKNVCRDKVDWGKNSKFVEYDE